MVNKDIAPDVVLVGGQDTGNGYVKARIAGPGGEDIIDVPSGVSEEVTDRPDRPAEDRTAPSVLDSGFFDILDASIDSPQVAARTRHLYGKAGLSSKAVKSGGYLEFVLEDGSKSHQDLVAVLIHGMFAAKALKDLVARDGQLPQREIVVDVFASIGLPIREYSHERTAFAAGFTGIAQKPVSHVVTINNFETPVSVRLRYRDVKVLAEGESAQYAIMDQGLDTYRAGLDRARQIAEGTEHAELLAEVTAEDLYSATNTVGVDIGAGTVNFPVFVDGSFNSDKSSTLGRGYETMMEAALDGIKSDGKLPNVETRKQLVDLLLTGGTVRRGQYRIASRYAADYMAQFASNVVKDFDRATRGIDLQVGFVYGGGSGPVREQLEVPLVRSALDHTQGDLVMIYLDAGSSRELNREGFVLAARALAYEPFVDRVGAYPEQVAPVFAA